MKWILLLLLLITGCIVMAQSGDSVSKDSVRMRVLDEVVVTATRTEKNIEKVPIPVVRISGKDIKNRGMVRLNEILAEQTGLAIVNDHGQGIQIQGFDPAYTLILIDGEPLIGRTSGTSELSRIATGNIDKIEIIKGPASSLYGSEAMAGVVNIITATPPNGFSSGLTSRYGTNNSADLSLDAAFKSKKFSISGFVNRNSSDGYSLRPALGTNTVSSFYAYTLSGKSGFKVNDKTDLKLSVRYFTDSQNDRFAVDNRFVAGDGAVKDLNIAPSVTHHFSEKLFSTLRLYRSTYKTKSFLNFEDDKEMYDQTYFNQAFNRAELQNDYSFNQSLKLTAGAGAQYETVEATRYDNLKSFTSGYGYVQADWSPTEKLNVLAGGRYDAHSEYQSQFSPKLAASYKLSNKFTVLGSVGKGYKAPDFRQLYLNFTNAVAGYSVFGYAEANAKVAELQQQGQIQSILIDPSSLSALDAESSTSFNLGFRFRPVMKMNWTVNVFRNNIKNLIESAPIAIKTNGQSVFSYFNLNKIYTQGIDTDLSYRIIKNVELAGGFQYLLAFDQEVINSIKNGQVFSRDAQNQTVLVKRSDYGGLVNRSRYMANGRVSFQDQKTGFIASFRAIYRGRYGLGDSNGNGIIDQDNEYVKGYVLMNASVSKLLLKNKLRLQVTSDNLFNYKDPNFIANLPGRLVYAGISYNFSFNKF